MAKWISDSIISASGKLGGTVLSNTLHNMTMRAHAVPSGAAAAAQRVTAKNTATASGLWQLLTSTENVFWTLQASWLTYATTTGDLLFTAPYPIYAAAYANAQLIGTDLVTSGVATQQPIDPITGYGIYGALDLMTLEVFQGSSLAWSNAFVMGMIVYGMNAWSAVPKAGYTMLGGNPNGNTYTFGLDYQDKFGRPPIAGQWVALSIWPLSAHCLTPGLQYFAGPPMSLAVLQPTQVLIQLP